MAMDSFKKQIRSLAGDFDHMIILALAASLFLPFYFSMAVIAFVAIVVMVRHDKRAKAFRSPYTRFLLAFLLVPFFVSATYHNIMGMSYSILLLALVICGFYLRSVMTVSYTHLDVYKRQFLCGAMRFAAIKEIPLRKNFISF